MAQAVGVLLKMHGREDGFCVHLAAFVGCTALNAMERCCSTLAQDALTKTIPIWAAVLNRAVAHVRQQQLAAQQPGSQPGGQVESSGEQQPSASAQQAGAQAQPTGNFSHSPALQPSGPSAQRLSSAPASPAASPRGLQLSVGGDASDTASDCRERHIPSSSFGGGSSCSSSDSGFGGSVAAIGKPPASPAAEERGVADGDGAGPAWDMELHLPLWIGGSERRQIEARLPGFVQQLLEVGIPLGSSLWQTALSCG